MSCAKLWDAIVITCSDHDHAMAFEKECSIRQKNFFIHPKTTVLSVVDPVPNIGSGGATINAMIHVTEYISALEGHTVITSDVLYGKKILILHMGTMTPYSACSPGFLPAPALLMCQDNNNQSVISGATQLDVLLQMTMNKLASNSPPGFWICSCDRLISLPKEINVDWSKENDVYLFTVPVNLDTAANKHGVVKYNGTKMTIDDIIYKGSAERISVCKMKDNKVPIISGVVFLNTNVVETLLNVSIFHPLVLWTYLGVDSGSDNIGNRPFASEMQGVYRTDEKYILLSLFFDILLCMASNVSKEDYVKGERSGVYGTVHFPDLNKVDVTLRSNARNVLWDALNEFSMQGVQLNGSEFHFISHDPQTLHNLYLQYPHHQAVQSIRDITLSFKRKVSSLDLNGVGVESSVIINSLVPEDNIGRNTVILNSVIEKNVKIGSNCFLINLRSEDLSVLKGGHGKADILLPNDIVLESLSLNFDSNTVDKRTERIFLMFGIQDCLQAAACMEESTVFNQSWERFFKRTTILPQEIWDPTIPEKNKCLLNAKLFPVHYPRGEINILPLLWLQGSIEDTAIMNLWRSSWRLSMKEIMDLSNAEEEFSWRKHLHFEIGKTQLEKALKERMNVCLLPFFRTSIMNGFFEKLLDALDNVIKTSNDASVTSRTFACIADVLGCKAQNRGGLRSGPAANHLWKKGLSLLEADKVIEAVDVMATQRKQWTKRYDLLVRSARHYEGAFQILVRKAVATARQFINLTQKEAVAMSTWVTAEAPARLDIAGTWSDTPPICYENGGSVIMLSITIDGKKPIGCRVKRIPEPKIVLVLGLEHPMVIECKEFEDFSDYSSPNSPGALLKAAFFCTNILPLEYGKQHSTLAEYLIKTHQSGFVLQSWSDLPKGSGLGTSSILAGCILSALWKVVGLEHEVTSVLHAVLDLEQMLTTGGGWQDQVGGLCPGIKVATSKNQLPLQVETSPVKTPEGFIEKLERHLVVVFTGKTRLARNMLQDVLRNWNARSPDIVTTARSLITNANETIQALEEGNLELIGKCLNDCWSNKKKMAHGCEPLVCREIMNKIKPHVLGISLAGAGGGGFMCMITKQENAAQTIKEEIESLKIPGKPTVHAATIDRQGLVVTIDNQPNEETF